MTAVVLILLCLLLGGCAEEEKKTVTITVIHAWGGTESDHAAMREIYAEFQRKNPDINVQFIAMPTRDEMIRKVEDMIMVGNIPDVVNFGGMGENNVYRFMEENDMLIDLMPYVEMDKEFAKNISEVNLQYWTVDRKCLFNISDVISLSGGYWYNKKILKEAGVNKIPTSWSGFFEMCEKIQTWSEKERNGVMPLQPSAEGYLYFMDHILADYNMEDRFLSQNHKIAFNDADLDRAIEMIKKVYRYTTTEGTEYSYRDETSLFNKGKIALYVNGVWGAPMIAEKMEAEYALLPTESGTSMSCESACLGYVLGKGNDSAKQKASIRFLKYMLSAEVQFRIFDETGQIPASFHAMFSRYKDNRSRIFKAAETVLNAEKKIEVIDNFWNVSQKKKMADSIVQVLTENLTEQELKEMLRE